MKRFFFNNYRGIFHILTMLEFCFFFWLWGVDDLWSLDPNTIPFKFIMLIVIFLTAEWSIKKSGLKEFIEEEKKKIDN